MCYVINVKVEKSNIYAGITMSRYSVELEADKYALLEFNDFFDIFIRGVFVQLEAANRQLRSTRAFVEEQASEREAERDEFARRLQDLRDDNARLATRLQNNARILNEVGLLG